MGYSDKISNQARNIPVPRNRNTAKSRCGSVFFIKKPFSYRPETSFIFLLLATGIFLVLLYIFKEFNREIRFLDKILCTLGVESELDKNTFLYAMLLGAQSSISNALLNLS